MNIAATKTKNSITVSIDGKSYIILKDDGMFPILEQALRDKNEEQIKRAVSVANYMKEKSQGLLDIIDGVVYLDNKPIHGALGQRFVEFINNKIDLDPLLNFCRKLRKNPSKASIDQLFGFLDANKHPITKTGNFIAYKKIRSDFKDFHSGTFDNSPGAVLEMPRAQVNENPTQTCAAGLHVANWDYAYNSFHGGNGLMVEVEVDPADVVAVPIDYNQGKMRTCSYTVIKVITAKRQETLLADGERVMASGLELEPESKEKYCESCDAFFEVQNDGTILCDCDEEGDDEEDWDDEEEDDEEDDEEDWDDEEWDE